MSSRKMKRCILNGFALSFAIAGYSGSALADGGGGGCGSGGSGSPACLWSETFENVSNPLPSQGWSVTNDYGSISTTVAHNGNRSLKIYDKDPGNPTTIDASVTFAGSYVGNFSDVKLSFYWKPYNSETPDQLSVQLLSNGLPLGPLLPSIVWTHDDTSGWNKATLDFFAENLNPMGLTLNLNISDSSHFEGFYVDDFCLTGTPTTPVPEPETYAMMLAGLGLMGFIARRRKQNAAA